MLTIKELITQLSQYDPNETVLLGIKNGDSTIMAMLKAIEHEDSDGKDVVTLAG